MYEFGGSTIHLLIHVTLQGSGQPRRMHSGVRCRGWSQVGEVLTLLGRFSAQLN